MSLVKPAREFPWNRRWQETLVLIRSAARILTPHPGPLPVEGRGRRPDAHRRDNVEAAIKKFDDRLAHAGKNQPLDREVAQLQAELEQIYRMVVLLQKNESDMEKVAEIWGKMVGICDEFARRLSALSAHRASYDRILDVRNAAEERRRLHCRA